MVVGETPDDHGLPARLLSATWLEAHGRRRDTETTGPSQVAVSKVEDMVVGETQRDGPSQTAVRCKIEETVQEDRSMTDAQPTEKNDHSTETIVVDSACSQDGGPIERDNVTMVVVTEGRTIDECSHDKVDGDGACSQHDGHQQLMMEDIEQRPQAVVLDKKSDSVEIVMEDKLKGLEESSNKEEVSIVNGSSEKKSDTGSAVPTSGVQEVGVVSASSPSTVTNDSSDPVDSTHHHSDPVDSTHHHSDPEDSTHHHNDPEDPTHHHSDPVDSAHHSDKCATVKPSTVQDVTIVDTSSVCDNAVMEPTIVKDITMVEPDIVTFEGMPSEVVVMSTVSDLLVTKPSGDESVNKVEKMRDEEQHQEKEEHGNKTMADQAVRVNKTMADQAVTVNKTMADQAVRVNKTMADQAVSEQDNG